MSSRRPRSRFAASLVVTLALAPGCLVRTGPSAPPPERRQVADHRGDDTITIANPPRPADGSSTTAPPTNPGRPPRADSPGADRVDGGGRGTVPPRQPDGTTDVVQGGPTQTPPSFTPTTWMVFQRADKGCYAVMEVQCPPAPATCNPPPPRDLVACPPLVTEKKPVKIRELSSGECFITPALRACPKPPATCNPPRPIHTECP